MLNSSHCLLLLSAVTLAVFVWQSVVIRIGLFSSIFFLEKMYPISPIFLVFSISYFMPPVTIPVQYKGDFNSSEILQFKIYAFKIGGEIKQYFLSEEVISAYYHFCLF